MSFFDISLQSLNHFLVINIIFVLNNGYGLNVIYGQAVGVDNTSRRKWDREEYLERARLREKV